MLKCAAFKALRKSAREGALDEEIAAGIPQEVFGQTDKTARLVRRSLPSDAHRTQCTPKRGESLCRH